MATKLKNIDQLESIKNKQGKNLSARINKDKSTKSRDILVCLGGGCIASGAEEIFNSFVDCIKKHKLRETTRVIKTGCMGPCSEGPVVQIMPDNILYCQVSKKNVEEIVSNHIINNKKVNKLLKKSAATNKIQKTPEEIDYFKNQKKIALKNCGLIDPTDIEEYIGVGGYFTFAKTINGMKREDIIEIISNSGLRGRGGGGFPTGKKWNFAYQAEGANKKVLCNADEGDPGAFMDRSMLEGNPHSVIEGMLIAGYTINASKGYIYCRAEYPIAVERLTKALNQAKDYGLLGNNILNTDFSFDLELRIGAGAFVCGEETALISSIEGKRGIPRPRPPYPAQKGLWGNPTLINNVETYSNIAEIIANGAEEFSSLGTKYSKGTKVFALAGAINNSGLVEVPMGIKLKELIFDIGGGIKNDKKFKAAQIGGPSGGCIPEKYLDVSVDYESLKELGTIMGSGGLVIMDETSCIVDVARFFLDFVQGESCGKCTPCRSGTKNMLDILNKICSGEGEEQDIEKLQSIGKVIKKTSLCGLGQTAPNPVLTTIEHFGNEYKEHVNEKKCIAGVCSNLIKYKILKSKCTGCTACAQKCPVGAIKGEKGKTHYIIREKCIACGQCIEVCKFNAVVKE